MAMYGNHCRFSSDSDFEPESEPDLCEEELNEGDDSDEVDQEELEVALYSQVHYDAVPQGPEMSANQAPDKVEEAPKYTVDLTEEPHTEGSLERNNRSSQPAEGDSNVAKPKRNAKKTKKGKALKKAKGSRVEEVGGAAEVAVVKPSGAPRVRVEADEESVSSKLSVAPLATLLTKLGARGAQTNTQKQDATTACKKVEKGSEDKEKVRRKQVLKKGPKSLSATTGDDSVVLIESDSNRDASLIEISDGTDASSVESVDSDTDSLTMALGSHTWGPGKPEDILLTANVTNLEVDEHVMLQEMLDSLGECDWSVDRSDKFGTGTGSSHKRYYGKVNVQCHNCREKGHMSADCSKPKKQQTCLQCAQKGHIARSCPLSICHNCYRPGHTNQDCDQPQRSRAITCYRCEGTGHMEKECPDVWRQYHLTTNEGPLKTAKVKQNSRRFCCNCAKRGHFEFVCFQKRMNKFVEPDSPFVASYDSKVKQKQSFSQSKRKHNQGIEDYEDETPVKKTKTTSKQNKGSFKSKLSRTIASVTNALVEKVLPNRGQKNTNTTNTKTKKGRKKKKKGKVTATDTSPQNISNKKSKKGKNVKLEYKTAGDFERTPVSSQVGRGHQDKSWKSQAKQLNRISKHLNAHNHSEQQHSPWQQQRNAEHGSQGKKAKRPRRKWGKKGNQAEEKEESKRTVFKTNRGFRVTTRMDK